MNTYIGFSTLKARCTQFGFLFGGQSNLQKCKGNVFLESGGTGNVSQRIYFAGCPGIARGGPGPYTSRRPGSSLGERRHPT